jgi:hypothetical protein
LELARQAGINQILFFGPGSFPTNLDLIKDDSLGGSDDGMQLLGCPSETTLVRESGSGVILSVSEATGIRIQDLRFEDGYPALWFWNSAEVDLQRVEVDGSKRIGVLDDGPDTIVTGSDITIINTVADLTEVGEVGYAVQITDATASFERLTVMDSTTAGILVEGGSLSLTDSTVEGTLADQDGALGRGIQLQGYASATIFGGSLTNNADAGLYAALATSLSIEGLTVSGTTEAALPEGGQSGDGIVIVQGDPDHSFDPALFIASLTSNTITGCARAGILLEDVSASLNGNSSSLNGYEVNGISILAQGNTLLSGSDSVEILATPLSFNNTTLGSTLPSGSP